MKYKIAVLINLSEKTTYEFNKKTIFQILKEVNEVCLIDISKIIGSAVTVDIQEIEAKFILLQPNTIKEFKEIIKRKDLIHMYCLNKSFKYFYINYLLASFNVKKFIISNIGYNPDNLNYKNTNLFEKIKTFINLKLFYIFNRIMVLINLSPKIDYFFESSSHVINGIINGRSNKIKKIFPFINFSYYLNLIKINSKNYDNIFYNTYNLSEKYIVFVDGNIRHTDRIMREGNVSDKDLKTYFDNMNKNLNLLKKLYNKEVIVCLHPSTNENEALKQYDKGFKVIKYETEKYVSKAYVVAFHESSSIIQAISLKKKIIPFTGNCLGRYIKNRTSIYPELLKIKQYDLENFEITKKENFISALDKSTENYDEYIRENIVFDKSISGVTQVIQYLSKI
tara:strand:+ start:4858 stop:6042 length:1185 start_codon:yes stop_codon:yes gene_type:complete